MIRIVILVILFGAAQLKPGQAASFGVARYPTPVLNSTHFGTIFGGARGDTLKTDRCGQVRELEYIALPGTVFKILEELKSGSAAIYRVVTDEYSAPVGVRLYVDSRFLELYETPPAPRTRRLPSREEIVGMLKKSAGSGYVWGGNVRDGVPELAEWFYHEISSLERSRLTLAGVDCSGLLYQASGGWTPRNTLQLVSYGQPVPVAGKTAEEIAATLQPLDLIVWNGHVVIVLDRENAIESRLECGKPGNGGVLTTPLAQRLREIMRTRQPVDAWQGSGKSQDLFVVRRWYGL